MAHVTEGLLKQSLLAPAGPWTWTSDNSFFLIWSNRTPLSAQTIVVRDWILNHANADEAAA